MHLPKFNYHRPGSLPEALELLAELGTEAKILAGGTDLLVALKQRRIGPAHVIDLAQLKEISKIEQTPDGRLKIGAMVTLAQLAASPLVQSVSPALAQAAWEVGSPLLRTRGTVGGNIFQDTRCRYYNQSANWRKSKAICLKMGGEVCHVNPNGKRCLSTYAGDLAPALLAEEAKVEFTTAGGKEEVPVNTLFTGDGARPLHLQPQALATAVYLNPPAGGEEKRGFYWKLRSRPSIDFPLVGIAFVSRTNNQADPEDVWVKVSVTGLFSLPQLAAKTGEFLSSAPLNRNKIAQAGEMLRDESTVVDTGACPAWYRKQMLEQGLMEIAGKLLGEGGLSS